MTPPILVRLFAALAVAPGLAAWLVRRVVAAEVHVRDRVLVVSRRRLRVEVPCPAIAAIAPWNVPLPGPGISLVMRSGSRFRYGLEIADPLPLLAVLASVGDVAPAVAAARHPIVVYAHTRAPVRARRRWRHVLGKFVLFALLPTAVLFNAHQYIAYGGTFGEYYLLGGAAYARTFAVYWSTVTIYLVLYASVWRGIAEIVALVAAYVAPARAASARQAVEHVCRIAYYGGVPALLALRFMP